MVYSVSLEKNPVFFQFFRPPTRSTHWSMRVTSLDTLEKEMATHSSVLAWRIPGTGEPGGLPSMGSHRVGQDWSDLAAAAAAAWIQIFPPSLSLLSRLRSYFRLCVLKAVWCPTSQQAVTSAEEPAGGVWLRPACLHQSVPFSLLYFMICWNLISWLASTIFFSPLWISLSFFLYYYFPGDSVIFSKSSPILSFPANGFIGNNKSRKVLEIL